METGGGVVNERTVGLRFVSQTTISSYRRKIRTLPFFPFILFFLFCFCKFVFSAFLAVAAKMNLIRAQYIFMLANVNSFFPLVK